ncbi:nitrogen fixation protein FixH [Hymenobacter sp. NBH84]|uniref:FixH family protein n=1 Tax=Hymenobacter sp. NBH84 TaxID=2596915 RepID=UPI00162866CF|nr:FixH family protein [Hymenobacter sp. NBH84]QNE38133.1 nitrogen fixation protein FixH [Hymenobacter sp. NBH84]
MTTTPTRTLWPYAIVTAFLLFGSYIGYMVSQTMRTNVDLVSPTYYQQELAYQQRIESVARTAALPVAVTITHDTAASQLQVQLPPSFAGRRIAGQLHFFRPSNLHLDFNLPLQPGSDLTQRLNTQKMARGFWRLRVEFTADGQAYFVEKDLGI